MYIPVSRKVLPVVHRCDNVDNIPDSINISDGYVNPVIFDGDNFFLKLSYWHSGDNVDEENIFNKAQLSILYEEENAFLDYLNKNTKDSHTLVCVGLHPSNIVRAIDELSISGFKTRHIFCNSERTTEIKRWLEDGYFNSCKSQLFDDFNIFTTGGCDNSIFVAGDLSDVGYLEIANDVRMDIIDRPDEFLIGRLIWERVKIEISDMGMVFKIIIV